MPWIYFLLVFLSCSANSPEPAPTPGLPNYWYQGKAEVSVFDLQQNRYNALHPGEAVLIQVTEDFNTKKQVKSDRGRTPNSTPVMKTNLIERFTTGLYDYSVMTSTFTSVTSAQTLKVTSSSQDWCGLGFIQLNQNDKGFDWQQRSYFESEADANGKMNDAMLEDELFNLIRMYGPEIPSGEINILPATRFIQHKHIPIKAVKATIDVSPVSHSGTYQLKVGFPSLDREKVIEFSSTSPYHILGWQDTYPSAFDGKKRTTKATLKKREMTAYWQKNDLKDQASRESLDLSAYD